MKSVLRGMLLAVILAATGSVVQAQRTTLPQSIQENIVRSFAAPALKNATVSMIVRALPSGTVLFERLPDTAVLPASNQKICTAFLALRKLGGEFRYRTQVLRDRNSTIDSNGILRGDLFLRGSGDPSLTSERLLEIAKAVRATGIQRIEGRIIADGSAFDEKFLGFGWQWDDEAFAYSAQVGGLNCDGNTIPLEVLPGATPGAPARIRVGGENALRLGYLGTSYVRVGNAVVTSAKGTKADVTFDRVRGRNELMVTGTIPEGGAAIRDDLTVEQPNLFTATRFAELLQIADVQLSASTATSVTAATTPTDAIAITESQSAPLAQLIRQFLKASDNLYGECLLKTVGQGKSAEGASLLRSTLTELGMDVSGLNTVDGSGLSRMNTVTTRVISDILTTLDRTLPAEDTAAFLSALPIAGVDGTLRNRYKGTPGLGVVIAKTGSLSGVAALSGYLTTRAGERLVFSLIVNNYAAGKGTETRKAMDDAVLALLDVPKTN